MVLNEMFGLDKLREQLESRFGQRLETATKEITNLGKEINGLRGDVKELANVLRQAKKALTND